MVSRAAWQLKCVFVGAVAVWRCVICDPTAVSCESIVPWPSPEPPHWEGDC